MSYTYRAHIFSLQKGPLLAALYNAARKKISGMGFPYPMTIEEADHILAEMDGLSRVMGDKLHIGQINDRVLNLEFIFSSTVQINSVDFEGYVRANGLNAMRTAWLSLVEQPSELTPHRVKKASLPSGFVVQDGPVMYVNLGS